MTGLKRLTFFGLSKKTGKGWTITVPWRCWERRACHGRKAGRSVRRVCGFGVSKAWTGGLFARRFPRWNVRQARF